MCPVYLVHIINPFYLLSDWLKDILASYWLVEPEVGVPNCILPVSNSGWNPLDISFPPSLLSPALFKHPFSLSIWINLLIEF